MLSEKALPWTEALIQRYADRWRWNYLASIGMPKILPQWSEASIRAVMDRMISKTAAKSAGSGRFSGPAFDEETYAKAKPMFVEAMRLYAEAGREFAEWVKYLIEKAGVGVMPAVRRFTAEVRAGDVHVPGVNDEQYQAHLDAQRKKAEAAVDLPLKLAPRARPSPRVPWSQPQKRRPRSGTF